MSTFPSIRRLPNVAVVAAVLLSAVSVVAGESAGQDSPTGALHGVVVDSVAGEPIAGVLIRLDTGPETVTARDGTFRLPAVEPGPHMVALLSADCRVTWAEVEVEPDAVVDARFRLPRAATGEERRAGEERRRSQGEVVTAREIDAMHVRSLAEVIRRVEPSMVGTAGPAGGVAPIRSRSRNSFTDAGLEPVVVVDGMRAADGSRAIHSIDPSEVSRLEILPGSAAGWEYGSDGAAGVIRITTGRDRTDASGSAAEACVVPDFPVGVDPSTGA